MPRADELLRRLADDARMREELIRDPARILTGLALSRSEVHHLQDELDRCDGLHREQAPTIDLRELEIDLTHEPPTHAIR